MSDNPASALAEWFASWQASAAAAGKINPHALGQIVLWHDGTGYLSVGRAKIGSHETPFSDLMRLADDWLLRDEAAILNATLGLTPKGEWALSSHDDAYLDAYLCQEIANA